jgi:hypothetical protein
MLMCIMKRSASELCGGEDPSAICMNYIFVILFCCVIYVCLVPNHTKNGNSMRHSTVCEYEAYQAMRLKLMRRSAPFAPF